LVSFKDNLNEKTKNPFLGTYLLVWLVRNWELVFTILNFDDEFKLAIKVNFIKDYYNENEFLIGLVKNIGWTFLILILTYALLNLSRLIINFSEKRINPEIYKLTDSKSIVLKSDYLKILRDRNNIQDRLDKERNARFDAENKIKQLEERLSKKGDSDGIQESRSLKIFEKLKQKDLIENFYFLASRINNGDFIEENNGQDILIQYGLIEFESESDTDHSKKYRITKLGAQVLDKIRYSEDEELSYL